MGRSITPLQPVGDDRERPSRRDDHLRGKVQNVRGNSSAERFVRSIKEECLNQGLGNRLGL
jgi:hypothetical protein